uniref:Fc fragment of IgG binding protein n=1 Tax=Podarcis muralis TaxID=64176 RepID=A0A670JHY8_PODMU
RALGGSWKILWGYQRSWYCGASSCGEEFVTAFLQNYLESQPNPKFELLITGYHPATTVTVTANKSTFNKKVSVNKQTVSVEVPTSLEMKGTDIFDGAVWIQADKEISVVSHNYRSSTSATTIVYPTHQLGTSYYVVTPVGDMASTFKEFAVVAYEFPTQVTIHLKGAVTFQGKVYAAGSRLVADLKAFQAIQLQSSADLSGSKVESVAPVAVLSGHSCVQQFSACDHVAEQLLPVSSWGTTFIVPPVPFQTQTDIVYVVASQDNTLIQYQSGATPNSRRAVAGEVIQFQMQPSQSYFFSANAGIQVLFFFVGNSKKYDPFLINVPALKTYCTSYHIDGIKEFDNFAVIVAKTLDSNGITLEKRAITNAKWTRIPGTEYSFSQLSLGKEASALSVEHPSTPFGLFILGGAFADGYGSVALCSCGKYPKLNCSPATSGKAQFDLAPLTGIFYLLTAKSCPENSHYEACGSPCPATCSDTVGPKDCSSLPCVGGCQCNKGFVLDEGECIPTTVCGCVFEGDAFSPGEQFWADKTCTKRCVCDAKTRDVRCWATSCRSWERCEVQNGVQDCYPFMNATCSAFGGPHYLSFDGQKFDFIGTCVYQFAALCEKRRGLADFQVLVQNDHRGSPSVSFTRLVEVKVDGASIVISRDNPAKVVVNGLLTNLPFSIGNGRISIYKRGQEAVVQTDFKMTVTFDWQSRATVTVPSSYDGALCGLCGNFNGNKQDDLTMKDGTVAPHPSDFGQSWKVREVPGCSEGGKGECPARLTIEKRQRSLNKECGLILAKSGPFRECHSKVDPEGYFQDCVYNYCFFDGQQAVICQVIASYASACQAAGVNLYPWRLDTFCSLSCAPNSHYELCASGCAKTCVAAPCPTKCQEDCVCNKGFVLSGDRCIPEFQCGCLHQGQYYQAGDTFYPSCQERCTCQTGGSVSCVAFSCGPNQECRLSDGVRKCHPVGSATCSASGDPHYLSFDGLAFDFQGTCIYTLARASGNSRGLNPFIVNVENEAWADGKASVTKMVSVRVYGVTLTLLQNKDGQVRVNGLFYNLPITVSADRIRVYQHGTEVLIEIDFGLIVTYDLVYDIKVTVPSTYQNQVEGLCGNYNGKKEDDFLLPNGKTASDVAVFGAAWKVRVRGAVESCSDGCSGSDCPVCEEKKREVFKQRHYCGILTASDGPFSACHGKVDPRLYFSNCVYDLCLGGGDSKVLCDSVQSYVSACQVAKVSVKPWRSPSFCPLRCPANSHYEICAQLCATSCAKITDSTKCPETCAEGCQCNDGFFFNGVGCVSAKDCGCLKNGRYYKPNEKVLQNVCQESCRCIPGQGVICEAHSCAANENCETIDGVLRCVNKDPCKSLKCREKETCRIENGQAKCIPDFSGSCWGWGDPHYHTFDTLKFDFMGTCSYTIAKYCGNDATLVPFTIDEKNDNRGNQAVSYVRLTNIYVYGYKISIHKLEIGKIRLNDIVTSLPLTLEDGKIKLYQSGSYAILQTDFGLQVSYDYNWYLLITIPSSYYGAICGLCGNFNQNPADDMAYPNGTKASSIESWASSWKVKDGDPFCWDHCQGNCPTCDESKRERYGKEDYCGLISQTSGGPFRECHAKVNPDDFFDSCIYDVCLNGGTKKMLCQALEAYAKTCRKSGATIYDWRTTSGCGESLPCPQNSHYEFCGNACPASCADRKAPSACKQPCVETCQCNDGYVLSVDKCVPVGSCGCTYNGLYYKPREEFWADETCGSRCTCDPTLGIAVCKPAGCKASEQCTVVNGVRGCHPSVSATCIATGDPHYTTFDGKKFDFMGTCIYQLAGLSSNDPTLKPFTVSVENNHRSSNTEVSYTKVVTLKVYNATIMLSQEYPQRIQVNGIFVNLPFYQGDKIKAYISGVHGFIKTDFDLIVTFDWNSYARVTVPSAYANAVGGLCGNNNLNPNDDFIMKDGRQTSSISQFAESWKVAEVPGCTPGCAENCPPCEEAQKLPYKGDRFCGVLIKKDGPFRQCHQLIDPTPYFTDCIFDVCQYRGRHSILCDAIGVYVAACQDLGAVIEPWRSNNFCSLACSPNSRYELCGNGCPATCRGLSAPEGCVTSCKEGCYCKPGFVLSGDQCVPVGSCGCEHQGNYYKKGEVFYPGSSCQERCQCADNGVVKCQKISCGPHEKCRVKDGVPGCHAVGCGKCSLALGSHYVTFDGRAYNFQGTCTYTLAKLQGKNSQLANFSVLVENDRSLTKTLIVSFHGYTAVIERAMKWKLKVDGQLYTLPMKTKDGKLWANQEGNNIILQSDFGLKVLFDTFSYILVSVPSNYQGHVTGLCGNFNSDRTDDFTLPTGKSTQNVIEFGASWKVPIDGVRCSDGCGDKCPICDAAKTAPYRPESSCGMIQAKSGPFRNCHSLVDPAEFFNHCLYDMCAANGARETLCRSIQAYVTICQAAGVTIGAWRTNSFCPLTCPPNSHYELCTRTCGSTCTSLSTPGQCSKKCFEGCQCDSGYLFDGDRCMAMENCGCVHDGRYIKVSPALVETVVSVCMSSQPVPQPSCSSTKCRKKETCQIRKGQPVCVAQSTATCWSLGDPHYRTFDKQKYNFMGTCTYTLAKTCGSDTTLPAFHITAKNENQGKRSVSFIGFVTVQVYGYHISVARKEYGIVRVNNQRSQLPISLQEGKLRLYQSGTSVFIETDFSLKVSYDWNNRLWVKIPSSFFENVCGLCGNYNGDPTDDFKTSAGSLAPSPVEFGKSWKVEDGNKLCWDDCHGECKKVTLEVLIKYKVETFCGWISKREGGPFSQCHSVVDPEIFVENCAYDLYIYEGHRETLCQALQSYADACQREGVTLLDWRRLTGCLLSCPENSQYKLCGSACPATCNDQALPSNCSSSRCMETCQCNEGFVLEAGKCIPKAACGCAFEGKLFSPGEQFWGDSTCTKRCICDPQSKQMKCQPASCKAGEQCRVENGLQNCYPTGYATCSAAGYSHYHGFDGQSFNFQGTCLYTFAGLSKKRNDLVDFQVLVQNSGQGSWSTSLNKLVKVQVYGLEITVSWAHHGRVLVNGLLTNLPYRMGLDQVLIYQKGWDVVTQTDFGLTINFDWQSRLTVTVPKSYEGALGGLCGNFNSNKQDDLAPSDAASGSTALGRRWKVAESLGCREVSPRVCPDLENIAQRQRGVSAECGLLVDKRGPFRECHGRIDPEVFFLDCVFDYCTFNGQKAVLGHVIAAYTAACQAIQVTIYIWRIHIFWKPVCPRNSHYELCGRSCQQTCSSLYSPLPCSAHCAEGCVCDEGFVLSGDRCVPMSQCGCVYQERYYTAGQTFYPTSKCNVECVCQAGGAVACKETSCGPGEECRAVDGVHKCHPVGSATCSVSGDPHYISFDGVRFNFQGTCTYVLAKAAITDKKNLKAFTITEENEAWGSRKVSVTKMVSVEVYGTTLTLIQNKKGQIKVNGVFHSLPVEFSGGHLRAYQHGTKVLIETDFGLIVSYDLVYRVTITVPGSYRNQMQGLCGNYNGKKEDDFLLPDGKTTSDVAKFGAAWKVPVPGAVGPCSDGCSGSSCPVCEKKKEEVFKQRHYCGILTAPDGPFSACHAKVDPSVYFSDCIYDVCLGNGDSEALCQNIQSYTSACQEAGIPVQTWRSPSFCPLSCPPNSQYSLCADLCSTHCAGITDSRICPGTCAEGCQCDDGFFFDGLGCVTVETCGCNDNGTYYKPHEKVMLNECQQICSCVPGRGVTCESHSCSSDEVCEVQDGVMSCVNKDPCKALKCRTKETCKMEDGRATCVPNYNETCWGWGDPHYHTFDGKDFDFQGTCTYTIAKYCSNDTTLVPFTVEAKNDHRGSQTMSYVRQANIYVYGHSISIRRKEAGRIRLNGIITSLPVTLEDGKLWLFQSGLNAVLQTNFGLVVTFDWSMILEVTLPSSYYGTICGLCGNFNQNPEDEMVTPTGHKPASEVEWAKSWKVNDRDPFCWDVCDGNCPTCEESQQQLFGSEEFCGLLTQLGEGPFRECHDKLSPDNFFDSCLYDVCLNHGAKNILCKALEAYATDCRKEGVVIHEWRAWSGCALSCPENSHYEACGNACPASCSDRSAPSTCDKPCVETCQCDQGYVLSTDKCVPVKSCGCTHNGLYYKPEEEFWADETCGSRCRCDPSLGIVVCSPASCKASERCMTVDGIRGCHPISYATCTATGDHHYTTFDGKRYDFSGTCIYQLAGLCSKDPTLTPFTISIQNSQGSKTMPFSSVVTLDIYNRTIMISQEHPHTIKVDGVFVDLPFYHEDKVKAYISGAHVLVITNFDLTVTFGWNRLVHVTVPKSYRNALCGLCGNDNQDSSDDLIMKGGTPAANVNQFAESWKIGEIPGCGNGCTSNCPVCEEAQKQAYKEDRYCGILIRKDGPFKQCHKAIDATAYFEDCVVDVCRYKGHHETLCSAISAYVTACQAQGIQIGQWRSASFCPSCPRNSRYDLCGNGCPVTCHGLSAPDGCQMSCKEGCYCDAGFVLSGDQCVPVGDCGCVYQGRYYKKGDSFVPSASCHERCRCGDNGAVECQKVSCGAQEECRVENGMQGCHSISCGKCSVAGGTQYLTFDGQTFNFFGSCTYTLAKVCSKNPELAHFSVVVENEGSGDSEVVPKMVVVTVDGEMHALPLVIDRRDVWVNQEGKNIVLQTDFGLKVLFDSSHYILVSVPSVYQGQMCGLCGNFNSDRSDEFQLPNEKSSGNVTEFGASWKVELNNAGCSDGCGKKCPLCDAAETKPYQVESSCGLIKATSGPFSECHSLVKPTEYYNRCLHGMCAAHGAKDILCQSLQAYVAVCQAAGANIKAWRTASFCPLACPANSQYELCTRYCDFTCAGLSAPTLCTRKCFEGCQCIAGFVSDGEACVPMERCGCVHDGYYIKAEESIVSKDCSEKCTCHASGRLTCEEFTCKKGEACALRNSVRACVKQEGQCTLTSGAQLTTFDGASGEILYSGAYEVASLCNIHAHAWFRVVVDVKECSDGDVMAGAAVYVFFRDAFIAINKNKEAWVRSPDLILLILWVGASSVNGQPDVVTISHGAGLQVLYGLRGEVTLKVKDSLAGKLCASCGNFNGDSSDDLILPNGKVVTNIAEVIDAWKARDFIGW